MLRDRLTNLCRAMVQSNPDIPILAGKIFLSTLSSLTEEKAWQFADGFLALADRVYREMEAERAERALSEVKLTEEETTKIVEACIDDAERKRAVSPG